MFSFKKGALGQNVIVLVWAVIPPLPVISTKQEGEKKRYNKCKYERGWEDWNLKKVSVYTDISRASPSRYEKDIVIQGGITESKKVNEIVFGYHIIMCLFLSMFFSKLK